MILGRTYADGTPADCKLVNQLQAKYSLIPLTAFSKKLKYEAPAINPEPGFSMTDKP